LSQTSPVTAQLTFPGLIFIAQEADIDVTNKTADQPADGPANHPISDETVHHWHDLEIDNTSALLMRS
jgi:hypothetical protein